MHLRNFPEIGDGWAGDLGLTEWEFLGLKADKYYFFLVVLCQVGNAAFVTYRSPRSFWYIPAGYWYRLLWLFLYPFFRRLASTSLLIPLSVGCTYIPIVYLPADLYLSSKTKKAVHLLFLLLLMYLRIGSHVRGYNEWQAPTLLMDPNESRIRFLIAIIVPWIIMIGMLALGTFVFSMSLLYFSLFPIAAIIAYKSSQTLAARNEFESQIPNFQVFQDFDGFHEVNYFDDWRIHFIAVSRNLLFTFFICAYFRRKQSLSEDKFERLVDSTEDVSETLSSLESIKIEEIQHEQAEINEANRFATVMKLYQIIKTSETDV